MVIAEVQPVREILVEGWEERADYRGLGDQKRVTECAEKF